MLPGLVYNSILSWANGWYFLMASEIIATGPARYTLPGLGTPDIRGQLGVGTLFSSEDESRKKTTVVKLVSVGRNSRI